MNAVAQFMLVRFAMLSHGVRGARYHSRLKMAVILSLVIGLSWGAFYVPYRAFQFLATLGHLGLVVIDRLLYLLFMGLFVMLAFSNAIISYATHYRATETQFMFTLPLRHQTICMVKFVDCLVMSSWSFLFFLIPIMVAYARVRDRGALFYVSLFAFFVPFAVVAASLGCGCVMLLVRFFPQRFYRSAAIAFGLGLLAVVVGMLFWGKAASLKGEPELLFTLSRFIPHFGFTQWPFSPHYWITEGLLSTQSGCLGQSVFWWLLLVSNALFGATMLYYAAERWYYAGWAHAGIAPRSRVYIAGKGLVDRILKIVPMSDWQRALTVKDIKSFWRDPMQWSQFTVFFGLLGIYFANLRSLGYETLLPFWKNIISFLNLSCTNLTLASLSVRFVFPQFSLEGKRYWIVGLAPLRPRDILLHKFFLNSVSSLLVSMPLIILSNAMLNVSVALQALSVFVVGLMCFSLTSLCIGLGVVFPNFKEDNPSQIVAGFGGTLALVLSLLYIAVVIGSLALPFHLFVTGQIAEDLFHRLMLVCVALVVFISVATTIGFLWGATRALRSMEF